MISTMAASTDISISYIDNSIKVPSAPNTTHFTDLGNAQRLLAKYRHIIRYCPTSNSWHIWNDRVWERDNQQNIRRLANWTVLSMYKEASTLTNDHLRDQLVGWARKSENHSRHINMIRAAEPYVSITPDQWNAAKNLLNCINGTLELDTLAFREHRRDDYLTKIAGVEYDSASYCPLWREHLSLVLGSDEELITAFQMLCGYTLLQDNPEQIFLILYGLGMNGKSVTLNVLSEIMGNYAVNVDPNTLMVQKNSGGPRSDIMRLEGARLITSGEGEDGDRLSEKLIKQLTGGDTITARSLYEREREIKISGKIWYATNHRPIITGTENAIWRRVWLIPFEVTIPPENRDSAMEEKLIGEAPGIFNWMIEGLKAYYANESRLVKPGKVQMATTEYRAESDIVGDFVQECCILAPNSKECIGRRDLIRNKYNQWCFENGEDPISPKKFASKLRERGVKPGPEKGGYRWWQGIRLISELGDGLTYAH